MGGSTWKSHFVPTHASSLCACELYRSQWKAENIFSYPKQFHMKLRERQPASLGTRNNKKWFIYLFVCSADAVAADAAAGRALWHKCVSNILSLSIPSQLHASLDGSVRQINNQLSFGKCIKSIYRNSLNARAMSCCEWINVLMEDDELGGLDWKLFSLPFRHEKRSFYMRYWIRSFDYSLRSTFIRKAPLNREFLRLTQSAKIS